MLTGNAGLCWGLLGRRVVCLLAGLGVQGHRKAEASVFPPEGVPAGAGRRPGPCVGRRSISPACPTRSPSPRQDQRTSPLLGSQSRTLGPGCRHVPARSVCYFINSRRGWDLPTSGSCAVSHAGGRLLGWGLAVSPEFLVPWLPGEGGEDGGAGRGGISHAGGGGRTEGRGPSAFLCHFLSWTGGRAGRAPWTAAAFQAPTGAVVRVAQQEGSLRCAVPPGLWSL